MYIRADHAAKTYRAGFWGKPVHALKGVNLEIGDPGLYGLVGPNGAGKSTLIKLLVGMTRPTSGFVSIGGESPQLARTRKQLSYLAEVPSLPPLFTPDELLRITANLMEVTLTPGEMTELLEKVDIAGVRGRRVATFSKGMRQRLGLALARVGKPNIMILDEPMSGLDPIGRHAVKEMIKEVGQEGATILYSSHVLSDVQELCQQVFVMAEGEIKQRGNLLQLAPYQEGLMVLYRKKDARATEEPQQAAVNREDLAKWMADHAKDHDVLEVRPNRDTLEDLLLKVSQP